MPCFKKQNLIIQISNANVMKAIHKIEEKIDQRLQN